MFRGFLSAAAAILALSPEMASTRPTSPASSIVPTLEVPCCPAKATIRYDRSVPDLGPFPRTQVDLCYDATAIQLTFTALDEATFYFNPSHGTNDDIWAYEVMEAFISAGDGDPQTYLEFEVSPNNVTYNAFILNPSKVRADGAPFGHAFIDSPLLFGMKSNTTLDKVANTWVSTASIPMGLFNVDDGEGKGTRWRMNFFRTTTSPETFPQQGLGAWSPPDAPSFHKTPFFGHVTFV